MLKTYQERLRDRVLRERHGEEVISELADLEAGIAVADGVEGLIEIIHHRINREPSSRLQPMSGLPS
jgi:hypothetical protein